MKKDGLDVVTEVWRKYEAGKNHHREEDMYERTARAWRFYEGEQWRGVQFDGMNALPCFNIIKPMVDYKSITVASQNVKPIYSPHDGADQRVEPVCKVLNKYAAHKWEALNMDKRVWDVVFAGCVAGDTYLYFYNKALDCQLVDNTSIYFADEQNPDVQAQEYIIIQERRPVAAVRREAEKRGVKKAELDLIVADSEDDAIVGDNHEVNRQADDGKCMSVLFFDKDENGDVRFCRSTRSVVYQPTETMRGMKRYPIARFAWDTKKNSARGIGEVTPQVNNQIEINRLLVRRLVSAKLNAFAKPVYSEQYIDNPADVDKVGKPIRLRSGTVNSIKDYFGYVAPAPMSPEAGALQQDMIQNVRNLSGSGDAAIGNVNPERAAASAIIAIRDQAASAMNKPAASYREFLEDVALVWLEMWKYHGDALESRRKITASLPMSQLPVTLIETSTVEKGDLNDIILDVRIDATPTTPFSVYATEQNLQVLMQQGHITFEEFVDALPDSTAMPKSRLKQIIESRGAQMPGMTPGGIPGAPSGNGTNVPMSQGGAQPVTVQSVPMRAG